MPINLQNERLGPAYRRRLRVAGDRLSNYCYDNSISLSDLAEDPAGMNQLLVDFIQYLFSKRVAMWWAIHAILSVQLCYRPLKGQLRMAWDSIESWRLRAPVLSRRPMQRDIMQAIALFGIFSASSFEPRLANMWLSFSVCIMTGWWGLLRPAELLNLTVGCLKLPKLCGQPWLASILIKDAKNRAYLGRLQTSLIRDEATVSWLVWYTWGMSDFEPLWIGGRALFVSCLKQALSFLKLMKAGFTAGSLRAGGATYWLENGLHPATIRYMGRWSSEKSMMSYLQEAESAWILLNLDSEQLCRLELTLEHLWILSRPP